MSKPSKSKLRKLRTIIPTLAVFAAAAALAGESSSSSNDQLPAGPMQEKAVAACSTCHEARIIVQQRLSKPADSASIRAITFSFVDPPANSH